MGNALVVGIVERVGAVLMERAGKAAATPSVKSAHPRGGRKP